VPLHLKERERQNALDDFVDVVRIDVNAVVGAGV
jgi:hypothetical protein